MTNDEFETKCTALFDHIRTEFPEHQHISLISNKETGQTHVAVYADTEVAALLVGKLIESYGPVLVLLAGIRHHIERNADQDHDDHDFDRADPERRGQTSR